MKAFSITDIGESRRMNEDYVFCKPEAVGKLPNLFVVADGMGGHNAGDYASRYCVEYFTQRIVESEQTSPIAMIEKAIGETNDALRSVALENSELEGMGTTFLVAVLFERELLVANIGDSRLYVIGKHIRQITQDHSLVEEMVKNGELNREEARVHPNKNIVTRALGAIDDVHPDFFEVSLSEDDIVLMCSDGLSNMLEDKEIEQIIRDNSEDLSEAARVLVQRANENGGKDNITVVVLEMK